MKKIIFFLLLVFAMLSCSKEQSMMQVNIKPKDSTFIRVDHRPMERVLTAGETGAE